MINIEGYIGIDWTAEDLRRAFMAESKDAPDEIEITINSPGGLVWDGIAMHNTIRSFIREGASVKVRIVGLCASIATYIACAGEKILVEDNAVWMIHNPMSFVGGDYRDMTAEAEVLDRLAGVIARGYARRAGLAIDTLREMMDAETYLYGEEIETSGFADNVVPAGDGEESRDAAISVATISVAATAMKCMRAACEKKVDANFLHQHNALVDYLDEHRAKCPKIKPKMEELPMTVPEIWRENPEAAKAIQDSGIEKEAARRNAIDEVVETDPDNEGLRTLCREAASHGVDPKSAAFLASVTAAVRDGGRAKENAPPVKTEPAGSGRQELENELKKLKELL